MLSGATASRGMVSDTRRRGSTKFSSGVAWGRLSCFFCGARDFISGVCVPRVPSWSLISILQPQSWYGPRVLGCAIGVMRPGYMSPTTQPYRNLVKRDPFLLSPPRPLTSLHSWRSWARASSLDTQKHGSTCYKPHLRLYE